jgi:DNA-binding NarL/FixJ family response regulator
MDPEVVSRLFRCQAAGPLDQLSGRERQVIALMAEGRSNQGIADTLVVTEHAVEKHVRSILRKLDIPHEPSQHRRILAVLAYLRDAAAET